MPPRAATLPLLLVQGTWSEARDLARITREHGSPLERHMATAVLGNLAYCQGNLREAWAMVLDLLPRGPATEPEDSIFPYAIEMLRLATTLALDESDANAAREWLRAHDAWLEWSGSIRGSVESRLLQARLHEMDGEESRAEADASEAIRLASDPRQPLALLAAHRCLGRLLWSEDRHSDASRHLQTALDLAEACAAPYERATTLIAWVDLQISLGKPEQALSALESVREAGEALQSSPLVEVADRLAATVDTDAHASELSPREVDVIRLVAQGLTDAEAAEILYISPRTVSQHLRSIYNKLGVSSRTAATRIAIERNLV